jgi:hypothetical protein
MGKRKTATRGEGADSALLPVKIRKAGRSVDRMKVEALCARIHRMPVLDNRTADEILGYDAFGIPR